MPRIFLYLSGIMFALVAHTTQAHQLSTSYLTGRFDSTGLFNGEWQVRMYDLEQTIGIDTDGDGNLRWQELIDHRNEITNYLQQHLQFLRAQKNCSLTLDDSWKIDTHFNEGYLVLPVRSQCAINGPVTLHYNGFFEVDNQHKLLVSITNDNATGPHILSDAERTLTFDQTTGSKLATFKEFIVQGTIHIWMGLDHILFLISLLLTCVLVRSNQHWRANKNRRDIIFRTTAIVTAFTLAHSITLTATALQWIQLPSRWIEVGIAITVALTALNNIFPLVLRLGWLTFGFGLLHGMGFAGALGELGLPADQQVLTVLAFNIGVEIGQMAIVLLALPLLLIARNYYFYVRYSMTGLSAVIVLVALQWTIQRI